MEEMDNPGGDSPNSEQPSVERQVNVAEVAQASQPYVGRWNQLVSTTNWEKGRIIFQWREALIAADAPAAQYSDDTWCLLVGGVTGQHVGRLRRVYQRFGESYTQYDQLYWSHFHAALDWNDAEMWLEGVVQNGWSVSQMRRQRWETLGADQNDKPQEEDIVASELDEDFEPALNQEPAQSRVSQELADVQSRPLAEGPDFGDADDKSATHDRVEGAAIYADQQAEKTIDFVRPFENLAELPDDLAEAFDSFKLAILRHKSEGWQQISRDDILASLDALKELAFAPTSNESPF